MAKKTAVNAALTREEVYDICKNWRQAKTKGIGESIRGLFSQKLNGDLLELTFDDHEKLIYRFESGEQICWFRDSGDFIEEYAQILELETVPGIFLVNHLRGGTFPLENITLIIDQVEGLVTLIHACIGDSKRPRDVERTIHFGYIRRGDASPTSMHRYTNDLIGKMIDWHYDKDNSFVVKHLYVNNEHMVYLLMEADSKEKGLVEAAECDYIKLREQVYIMSWQEKGHQGMQGTVVMDLGAMHDIGSFFGISILNTLDNYTFAANGVACDLGKQILDK